MEKRKRILFIDDNDTLREMLSLMMETVGKIFGEAKCQRKNMVSINLLRN